MLLKAHKIVQQGCFFCQRTRPNDLLRNCYPFTIITLCEINPWLLGYSIKLFYLVRVVVIFSGLYLLLFQDTFFGRCSMASPQWFGSTPSTSYKLLVMKPMQRYGSCLYSVSAVGFTMPSNLNAGCLSWGRYAWPVLARFRRQPRCRDCTSWRWEMGLQCCSCVGHCGINLFTNGKYWPNLGHKFYTGPQAQDQNL